MLEINDQRTNELLKDLLKQNNVNSLLKLLNNHHSESHDHSVRVGLYAIDMGYSLNLEERYIRVLGYSGLLHDIGKVSIDKEILCKPAELDHHERKIIKGHPRLGFIQLTEPEFSDVKKVVVSHHEYKDDPYPRSGGERRKDHRNINDRRNNHKELSEVAQIVAVVDIYDALANRRSYKQAMSESKVKQILTEQYKGDKIYLDKLIERL